MPLYFAYGSCMSKQDLARTVVAKEVGRAVLYNHKLAFTRYSAGRKGGVADIIYSEGDMVEGMLFQVPNFIGLDIREGHPYVYKRKKVKLYVPRLDKWVTATTYEVVNKEKEEVKPSKEYALIIWQGARRLSKEYRLLLRENLLMPRKKYVPVVAKRVPRLSSPSKISSKGSEPTYKYGMERLPFDWDEYLQSRWDAWVYE